MTNNPTIDGVSRELRELLERVVGTPSGKPNWDALDESRIVAAEELRALLDAPVVERQPAAPFYISIDDWNLLVRGDVEIASVRISRTRRSIFTESLFAHPPELAALQSEIERGEQHRNDLADTVVLQKTEIGALQSTIAQLQARVGELESGRGEPVAWRYRSHAGGLWYLSSSEHNARTFQFNGQGGEVEPLFATPPAPVAVVLPARRPDIDSEDPALLMAVATWNACLDATAALNGERK